MSVDKGMIEWVRECLEPLGPVTMRNMMGGATLYCDGTIFAIVAGDDLWFKADPETDAIWDEAGRERFTFEMKGKTGSMNYRRAPLDVHDDPDAMRQWARLGIEAGARAPKKKRRSGKASRVARVRWRHYRAPRVARARR
ncbi:MAG: TfoX/Sxy family protein [Parasphingopyxis sp.]|uniref:TfoX/Sxy family protein n=1 Tax=Parasphingopyxis sp. TaxID=1920299 RepID=UPI0032EBC497